LAGGREYIGTFRQFSGGSTGKRAGVERKRSIALGPQLSPGRGGAEEWIKLWVSEPEFQAWGGGDFHVPGYFFMCLEGGGKGWRKRRPFFKNGEKGRTSSKKKHRFVETKLGVVYAEGGIPVLRRGVCLERRWRRSQEHKKTTY